MTFKFRNCRAQPLYNVDDQADFDMAEKSRTNGYGGKRCEFGEIDDIWK